MMEFLDNQFWLNYEKRKSFRFSILRSRCGQQQLLVFLREHEITVEMNFLSDIQYQG